MNLLHRFLVAVTVALLLLAISEAAKKQDERDCEICIDALEKFKKELPDEVFSSSKKEDVKHAFIKFCSKFPSGSKHKRFCSYVGGTKDAATSIVNVFIEPLVNHLPPSKICKDKLKKMDGEICALRFDVKPDFTKLNKMRVSELKKILSNWNADNACKGCAEKSEFIMKIKELLPEKDPEEWKKVQEAEKVEL